MGHIAEGKEGEGVDYSELDAKSPEELTEEEKIALLGRPCLGANTRIQIRIKESKEFCSGGLRSNQAWVLRRNDAWLVSSEPQYGTLDLQLSPLLRPKNIQKSGQVSQVLEMVEESSGYKMCPVPRFTCHVSRVSLLLLFHCYFLQY